MTFGCQTPPFSVDLESVIDNLPSAVIVVDLNLPGMNGMELCRAI